MKKFLFTVAFLASAIYNYAQVAPEIAWKQITWEYLRPDGVEQETSEESGEDWWYSHIKVNKGGVHVGYMTTGYSNPLIDLNLYPGTTNDTYLNLLISRFQSFPNYALSDGLGDCTHLDSDPYRRGPTVGTVAFNDIAGNVRWFKSLTTFDLQQALQISDNEFLVVGTTFSTTNFDGSVKYIYNPNTCSPSPANSADLMSGDIGTITGVGKRKMYISKINADGEIIWEYIYGIRDYITDPNAAFNSVTEGFDIVPTTDGNYIAIGSVIAASGQQESFAVKINSNGCVLAKASYPASYVDVGTGIPADGSQTWGIASNGLGSYALVGREYLPNTVVVPSSYLNWTRGFMFLINNSLVAQPTYFFESPTSDPINKSTNTVDVIFHQNQNQFLVPLVGDCGQCNNAGNNSGDAYIYRFDVAGNLVPLSDNPVFFSNVNAFDLRVGLTETADGGYAAVSSRRNVAGTCPTTADLQNLPIGVDLSTCTSLVPCSTSVGVVVQGDEAYWDTDAVVAKYDATNTIQWLKTFDSDSDNPLVPNPREPYPGNLKRQECLYKITEDADGALVISGNTGHNFDDNYLVKLFSNCQTDVSQYNITDPSDDIITISGNPTWNSTFIPTPPLKVLGMVVVPAGESLTIDNITVEFADSRRTGVRTGIKVLRGGKLIVKNGAVLTSYSGCEPAMWEGIDVEGSPTHLQTVTSQHGIVEIDNSTVARAINGISTFARNNGVIDWANTGGAIVRVKESDFTDCWRGIEFAEFQIFNVTGNRINNISYVRENTFTTNPTYGDGSNLSHPYAFISSYNTWNISMYGNVFTNNRITTPYNEWGVGVVTMNSKLNLIPKCAVFPGLGPCPVASRIGNKYNNLFIGVDVLAAGNNGIVTVDQGEFNNCLTGIQLESAAFGNLTRNVFNISAPIIGSGFKDAVGIHLEGSWGYKVEENVFNSLSGTGTTRNNGIIVVDGDNGGGGINVYRNNFTNLSTGVETIGENDEGTQIDCNNFTKHALFGIADVFHADGFLQAQGTCIGAGSNPTNPQANQFFGATCNSIDNFQLYKNPSANAFAYSNHGPATNSTVSCVELGLAPFYLDCTELGSGSCPTLMTVDHAEKIDILNAERNRLINDISSNKNLIDGGNTTVVLAYLASTNNPGQIKNYLLARSPYLSDAVLIAAINKNLPNGILKQILIANSSLSAKVMNQLSNYSLPNGIRNQINSEQTGTGPMIELLNAIQYFETMKLLTANELVTTYLDTNRVDSAMYVLTLEGNTRALCAMVPLLIGRRDTTSADTVITRLEVIAGDMMDVDPMDERAQEIIGFCEFYNRIKRILLRPGGLFSLTYSERHFLYELSETNSILASTSQSILNFVDLKSRHLDGRDYTMPDGSIRNAVILIPSNEKSEQLFLKVYPNPTQGIVNIEVNNKYKGVLELRDLFGRLILVHELVNANAILQFSVGELATGIYTITYKGEDGKISNKLVVFK